MIITEAEPLDEPGPRIVFVNPTFSLVTGYHASEVIGKSPRLLQGSGTSRAAKLEIRKALEAWRPITIELLNYKKDGTSFWNEMSIVPAADAAGCYRYWISIERDTTEIRKSQRELTLRSLAMDASSTAIGVFEITDDQPTLVYGNKPFTALLQTRSGSRLDLVDLLPAGRRKEIVRSIAQSFARGQAYVSEEALTSASGRAMFAQISIEPVPAELGVERAALVSIQDKTEERARRQEMAEAHQMRAIGQFTGGVAHDFNNLLTIVSHCTELLLTEGGLTEDAQGLITMIAEAADSGASLTSQLLSFARRRPMEPTSIEVRPFLERLHSVLRRLIPSTIEVKVSLPGDVGAVWADPGQLESAILNLAINARDAIVTHGRIELSAHTQLLLPKEAATLDLEPGTYTVLSVADDGPGMPAEVLEKAFEPFFTTKEIGKGSGLGLSMVYGFARQSGGKAMITTAVGAGARVDLLLPASSRPTTLDKDLASPAPAASDRTVLIVEDNANVLRQVTRMVGSIGHRALCASNGVEALAILETDAVVDVLFTDVVMAGGLSGLALAEQALALRPDLEVVFTSGYFDEDHETMLILSKGAPFLKKPYRRSDLESALAGRRPR